MTYEIYRYIFTGAAILCGIMFFVSILLFFFLDVPEIIGDLSGATERKAIKNIREQNESSDNPQKTKAVKRKRGKRMNKKSSSGKQQPYIQGAGNTGVVTAKINTQKLIEENETTVLTSGQETTVLTDRNETTLLNAITPVAEIINTTETGVQQDIFTIEYEITFIHSDELVG